MVPTWSFKSLEELYATIDHRTTARFKCLACGFESNADWNASLNIAERFGDDELNRLPFCAVKSLLEQRFQARLPVPRSGTAEPGSAPAMAATAINGQPVQLTPMNGCL